MKKIKTIQIKAAVLVIVFSLNTIIGFACAVGLGMGFNSHHHHEETKDAAVHIHADVKHHHEIAKIHHEDANNHLHKTTNDEDNCCHDRATKIAQQDKAIAQSINIVSPVFFTAFIAGFYNAGALLSTGVDSHFKYFVRSHHPPIPDIRIAIQSFQI